MSRHTQYECCALAPNAFICSCHFINTVGTGAKRASLSFSSAVQLVFFPVYRPCNSRDGWPC